MGEWKYLVFFSLLTDDHHNRLTLVSSGMMERGPLQLGVACRLSPQNLYPVRLSNHVTDA